MESVSQQQITFNTFPLPGFIIQPEMDPLSQVQPFRDKIMDRPGSQALQLTQEQKKSVFIVFLFADGFERS